MKWRKALLMMLVFGAAVVGSVGYAFAATQSVDDQSTATVPTEANVTMWYEGNNANDSYNYYRLSIKFGAQSMPLMTAPKSLVIYEQDITGGVEGQEREVHRVTFGDAIAGKSLKSIGEQPFLDKYDAFYYRNFIVKHAEKDKKYRYKAVLMWKDLSTGVETIRTTKKEVNVTKDISTQSITIGTPDNFGRAAWAGALNKNATYLPKKHTVGTDEKGFGVTYTGFTDIRDGLMNRKWGAISGETTIIVSVPQHEVFIANASLETHVIYTGPQLMGNEKIKAYIKNQGAIDNSLDVGDKKHVPALSDRLTEIAKADQSPIAGVAPAGVYPKKHLEIYMGMGSGPQGDPDEAAGDNENDVSFILGNASGTIHGNFELHLEYENLNPTPGTTDPARAEARKDFIFDYIKVTYNPIIFTGGIKAYGDSYVKPEGFLMLNKKINFKEALIAANQDASLTEAQILAAGKIDAANGSKMRISLKELLESDLNQHTIFLNKDGTPFDGSSINLTVDGKTIRLHGTPGLPADAITYKYDPVKKQIIIEELGGFTPKADYTIKLIIPTKRNTAFNKTVSDYNTNIFLAGKTYPLKIDIIENHPLLVDSNDELVRYTINNTVKPYKMPGIN